MFLKVSVPGLKISVPKRRNIGKLAEMVSQGTDWWQIISVLLKIYQSGTENWSQSWSLFKPLFSAVFHIFFFSKTNTWGIISIPLSTRPNQKIFFIYIFSCWATHATIFSWFRPNLIIFGLKVSALYELHMKTTTSCIISIPMSIRLNQNIFFVFLCLGHSFNDALQSI